MAISVEGEEYKYFAKANREIRVFPGLTADGKPGPEMEAAEKEGLHMFVRAAKSRDRGVLTPAPEM